MNRPLHKKRGKLTPLSFANNTTTDQSCKLLQRYDYIPLDFIKARVIGLDKNYFLDNSNLIFTPQFEQGTTDTVKYWYLLHENIKIRVYETGAIFLSGSLHKYFNNGIHNYNDFGNTQFDEVVSRLNIEFGILPENLYLLCIEYGVNISPPIDTTQILNNCFEHKKVDFVEPIRNVKGTYKQVEHTNYILKVYDKGKQYDTPAPILRIEVKQTNWSEYRKQGFNTLKEFIKTDKLIFVRSLLDKWDKVVFYDPTNTDIDRWNKYNNVNFWRELRTKGVSNTTYSKHRNRLTELNKEHGENTQLKIYNSIVQKVNSLQGVTNSTFNKTTPLRLCKLTRVNISMQRNDSFLLSHTGLWYLLRSDINTFQRIKQVYLSENWITSSIDKQVKEIAHNIRAKYNYRARKYSNGQLTIFVSV